MSYTIVTALPEHLDALPAIESAAVALFPEEDLTDEMRRMTCCPKLVAEAQAAGRLFVALVEDRSVGFALTIPCGAMLHLEELDVHPDYGRRGIGRALVEHVLAYARDTGCAGVTLNTFRHIPWNAPFYERVGFRILREEELLPHLQTRIDAEREEGFDMSKRVAMCHLLACRP